MNPAEKLNKYTTLQGKLEGFYMVTKCAFTWFDTDIIQACEVRQHNLTGNVSNLIQVTPVTVGNVTYKNAYCAFCNHLINVSEYIFWQSELICNNTDVSMLNGSRSNNSLETVIKHCQINKFQLPFLKRNASKPAVNLSAAARSCMIVETKCLPYHEVYPLTNMSTFEYECLQLSCHRQTEYVRAQNRYFKNRFCAVCNGFNLSEVECTAPLDDEDKTSHITDDAPSNFVMLMDFTSSGHFAFSSLRMTTKTISHSCPINQVYDPHIQQCRRLTCIAKTNCDKPNSYSNQQHTVITFNLILSANVSNNILNNSFHDNSFLDEFENILYHRLTLSLNTSIMSLDISVEASSTVFVTATVQQPAANASLTLNLGSFSLHGVKFTHILSETNSELHLDCPLITLNTSEFNQLSNGTVIEKASGMKLKRGEYILLSNGRLRHCSNYSRNYTTTETDFVWNYKEFVIILSVVGSILNIISCSIVLLTYACFKSLRTLPGFNLINLVTAILLSHLVLITGAGHVNDIQVCTAVAFFLHFFFFSTFTWSSVAAFDILRTFVIDKAKSHLRTVSMRQTIMKYCAYGWGLPLLVCTTCLLLDKVSTINISYGNKSMCWITNANALIVVFIVPVSLIILFNSVVFVVSARAIHIGLKHSATLHALKGQSQRRRRSSISLQPETAKKLKKEVTALFSIFSLLSLTWVFALIAASKKTSFFWYPFMVFTSLQGVFLLISYVLKKQVRQEYKRAIIKIVKRMDETSRSSTNDKRTSSTKL